MSKKSRKQSRKRSSQVPRIVHPPVIAGNTYLIQKMRYSPSSTLSNYPVSGINILQSLGIMAVSSSVGYAVFGSFRIKEIEMWTCQIPTSGSPLATCSVSFPLGTSFQSNREFTDSSLSSSFPAHIRVRPPGSEYAAFWQTYLSFAYVAFSCTQNTIIDVTFECVLRDGSANIPATSALIGATAGAIYYSPLDGIGGNIAPVARASI